MVCSEGLSSRQSQAKRGLAAWMIIMGGRPEGVERRGAEATPITTQQIPASLAPWSKNREKIALAMQSTGKTGLYWGNGFLAGLGSLDLENTCEQSNRLPPL